MNRFWNDTLIRVTWLSYSHLAQALCYHLRKWMPFWKWMWSYMWVFKWYLFIEIINNSIDSIHWWNDNNAHPFACGIPVLTYRGRMLPHPACCPTYPEDQVVDLVPGVKENTPWWLCLQATWQQNCRWTLSTNSPYQWWCHLMTHNVVRRGVGGGHTPVILLM